MLDIKKIREDFEGMKAGVERRGKGDFGFDRIRELDVKRRGLLAEVEALKNKQNVTSREVPKLKKEGKDVSGLFKEMKQLSGRIKELVTHKDETRWDILKFQKDRAGKETCYSIATVEFEDPKTQEEFNLRSVGARLVDDIDATDLKNLKKITTMIYEHCHWMHEERLGYEHTEL